jgi:hypothetical protein
MEEPHRRVEERGAKKSKIKVVKVGFEQNTCKKKEFEA